jgi:flagellar hook-basal body complex protein FliE
MVGESTNTMQIDKTVLDGLSGQLFDPAVSPNGLLSLNNKEATTPQDKDALGNFGDLFKQALAQVSQLEQQSGALTQRFAAGDNVPLHEVMIASEKSGMAMDLTVQIRNKLLTAYQELSRLQV